MRVGVRRNAGRLSTIVLAFASVIVGCGLLEESPPASTATPTASNVLVDAGFETTNPPAWLALGSSVPQVLPASQDVQRSGLRSARFESGGITGAVQSIPTGEFPEFLSGYYRVERWPDEGAASIRFSVRAATGGFEASPEIGFVIAGNREGDSAVPEIFLSRAAPVTGEWTYFAYPVRQAFTERLLLPATLTSVEVLLEVRSDANGAVVHFDDLYLGPQTGNPNRPKETRE